MELVIVVITIAQRSRLDLEQGDEVGNSPLITLRAAKPYQDARDSESAFARLK